MNNVSIFWLQTGTSLFLYSVIAAWYVWPILTTLSRNSALTALLWVHVSRYIGMTLLVPGMIDPKLPGEFLSHGAYGDLVAAAMAFASIFALRKHWSFAIPLVWASNIWGLLDMVNGGRSIVALNFPSYNLDTVWYIATLYGPTIIVSHVLIFVALVRPSIWAKSTDPKKHQQPLEQEIAQRA